MSLIYIPVTVRSLTQILVPVGLIRVLSEDIKRVKIHPFPKGRQMRRPFLLLTHIGLEGVVIFSPIPIQPNEGYVIKSHFGL